MIFTSCNPVHIAPVNIDLTYLHSVTGDDKVFEKTLLTSAVANIESQVQVLKQAWMQQDGPGVRQVAHSLKPVTAIAGLPQLENYCKTLDMVFLDGMFHPEEMPVVDALVTGWSNAKLQLEKYIATAY